MTRTKEDGEFLVAQLEAYSCIYEPKVGTLDYARGTAYGLRVASTLVKLHCNNITSEEFHKEMEAHRVQFILNHPPFKQDSLDAHDL